MFKVLIFNLPCPNLDVAIYCHISKLYLETCSIMRGPYQPSCCLLPSRKPTLMWVVCCNKLRPRNEGHTSSLTRRRISARIASEKGISTATRGSTRSCACTNNSWASPTTSWKVTSTIGEIKFGEFLSQYKVWALGKNFSQWKFCRKDHHVKNFPI